LLAPIPSTVIAPVVDETEVAKKLMPYDTDVFKVEESPLIVIFPAVDLIMFVVPVTAAPPQPIRVPKWLPEPVEPAAVFPSRVMSPVVVVVSEVFSISMPELCPVPPMFALS
jgi:hypothetical protein